MDFTDIFNYLAQSGFSDTVLPFLLLFVLCYTALSMAFFVKKDKQPIPNNLRIVIAMAFSLLMIGQHIANPGSKYDVVMKMSSFFANISLLMVAMLFVLLAMGLVGSKVDEEKGNYFTIFAIAFVIYLMGVLNDFFPPLTNVSSDTISAAIAIVVFFLIITYVTGGPKKKDEEIAVVKEKK